MLTCAVCDACCVPLAVYVCAVRSPLPQYKMYADDASTFHDITVGDNICPEEYCGPNCKGYVATTGWDPVSS